MQMVTFDGPVYVVLQRKFHHPESEGWDVETDVR